MSSLRSQKGALGIYRGGQAHMSFLLPLPSDVCKDSSGNTRGKGGYPGGQCRVFISGSALEIARRKWAQAVL